MKKPKTARKKKSKPRKQAAPKMARRATTQLQAKEAPPPKKTASTPAPGPTARAVSRPKEWWVKGGQFFREVKVELKKVTWPSRKETLASTSVVMALVLLAATFLGLIDLGLSRLIRAVIG